MKFIQLCTTDGNAWVNIASIVCFIEDPSPSPNQRTTMVHLADGKSYECSDTPTEIIAKIERRERDA